METIDCVTKENLLKQIEYYKKISKKTGDSRLQDIEKLSQFIQKIKQGEKALKKAHDELEKRVAERTEELSKANEQLQKEIAERKIAEAEILQLNEKLEERVKIRTAELERSMETLKETQDQLIEAEKNSALSGLVAGVAHEINTPVGVSVTAASLLSEQTRNFSEKVNSGNIRKSDFKKFIDTTVDSSTMILTNLQRASELIKSFKMVAIDQTSEKKRSFNLNSYITELLHSIRPEYKKKKHSVVLTCPDTLEIDSYPGTFSQIITNLIMNSLIHGFEERENGEMTIDVSVDKELVHLIYKDNGKGMNKENVTRIFEPFHTTKRGQGGTGLGMHIVYNLITQKLKGQVQCSSELGKGTTISIVLPMAVDN